MNLNPTSVAAAGVTMAPGLGYEWPTNRREVVAGVNDFRNSLFNKYSSRKLFDTTFHCFIPQLFPLECVQNRCVKNCYWGFTLPADTSGVVTAWQGAAPLKVHSRWRESHNGRLALETGLSVTQLPGTFPTERVMRAPSEIKIFAESNQDTGKRVFMEARVFGKDGIRKLSFDLEGDGWVVSIVPVCEIISVTLPAGRCGHLTLCTADGTELSVYAPWETVPAYQRVKLNNPCNGNAFIQGTKRFVPVWFDEDVVEIGDELAMKDMAVFLRFNRSRDRAERLLAAEMEISAWKNLDGLVARYMASAKQDGRKKTGYPSKSLPGYGRSHRA